MLYINIHIKIIGHSEIKAFLVFVPFSGLVLVTMSDECSASMICTFCVLCNALGVLPNILGVLRDVWQNHSLRCPKLMCFKIKQLSSTEAS